MLSFITHRNLECSRKKHHQQLPCALQSLLTLRRWALSPDNKHMCVRTNNRRTKAARTWKGRGAWIPQQVQFSGFAFQMVCLTNAQ